MVKKWYGTIDETTARAAKNAYSMFDYMEGSATSEYKASVDKCYEIACDAAEKRPNEEARIQALFDRYVKKLADNINAQNRNTASCPSIMICGGSNFPVAKKEKQNRRTDTLMRERQEIESIKDKLRSIAQNTAIYSDDENAVAQLEEKAAKLRSELEWARAMNAYYRKNKSLKGFEGLSDEKAERLDASIKGSFEQKPFPSYTLTSLRERAKAAEERAEKLKKAKAVDTTETQHDGFTVVEDTETMRIKFIFDGKPEQQIIDALKANGFRWAPSQGAWQRQLTENGRRAVARVIDTIEE